MPRKCLANVSKMSRQMSRQCLKWHLSVKWCNNVGQNGRTITEHILFHIIFQNLFLEPKKIFTPLIPILTGLTRPVFKFSLSDWLALSTNWSDWMMKWANQNQFENQSKELNQCIKLEEVNNYDFRYDSKIRIIDGNGCWSYIGTFYL